MHDPKIIDIAIVGGGYSGTLAAVNLTRAGLSPAARLLVIDPGQSIGRGLAYGTWDDNFLLNVPAGNMSALDGEPNHFVEYCRTIDPAFNEGSFVSRRLYGDYLQHALQQAARAWGGTLQHHRGRVTAVHPRPHAGGFELQLADGTAMRAGRVVLAPGHFAPKAPAGLQALAGKSGHYVDNPWDFAALNGLDPRQPVLLVGTGLTAIDALFRINGDGNRKVILLSRKGLLPQGHRPTPRQPLAAGFPASLDKDSLTVLECMRYLRRDAKRREAEGGDWRDTINALRAHTPDIWQRWPAAEKRRFLRHAVGYWDVHRHRLAPVADARLRSLLSSGSTEVMAGRLVGCEESAGGVEARIRLRGSGNYRSVQVGTIVNCTGPNTDLEVISDPLIMQLLSDGLVSQDDACTGLRTGDAYEVIGGDGHAVRRLYYVGPMLKAAYWEAIAVPELRAHARRLAQSVIADLQLAQPASPGACVKARSDQ